MSLRVFTSFVQISQFLYDIAYSACSPVVQLCAGRGRVAIGAFFAEKFAFFSAPVCVVVVIRRKLFFGFLPGPKWPAQAVDGVNVSAQVGGVRKECQCQHKKDYSVPRPVVAVSSGSPQLFHQCW